MTIRSNRPSKSHINESGSADSLPGKNKIESISIDDDPLAFYTSHPTKPEYVDLNDLATGLRAKKGTGHWSGPFTGRPELIEQLAPAIRDQLSPLAKSSVRLYIHSLRKWWRLFDAAEAGGTLTKLNSVSQLVDVHRQLALDRGISRNEFLNFTLLANITRLSFGLKPLYWQPPDHKKVTRHLPPQWQTSLLRQKLKHIWFSVIDRWSLAEELRAVGKPLADEFVAPSQYVEQERLIRNYTHYDKVKFETGMALPQKEELAAKLPRFYKEGYRADDMRRGSYPDGFDIRAAFHLCLASTGWNPAVLLSLDVAKTFIEPHPKDPARYILRGIKDRAGGSEQINQGLFKSVGSAGAIILKLLKQTSALRDSLRKDLERLQTQLSNPDAAKNHMPKELRVVRTKMAALEQGVRSPWIYFGKMGIQWLTDVNFAKGNSSGPERATYLTSIIDDINLSQPADKRLSRLRASDLRDAYASNVYHFNGGSVLAVMKALGHSQLSSTQRYLQNTLLLEEHRKLFDTFSNSMWNEMETEGRIDSTILAHRSRYGNVNSTQRERLHTYRNLMTSRVGVGCINPTHPPKRIDPNFVVDGKAMCHVQRCTLCLENAVILPESLPGLCKRFAELQHLQSQMSAIAFSASNFSEELNNTELALLAFNAVTANGLVADWQLRIANGTHSVVEYDGIAQEAFV